MNRIINFIRYHNLVPIILGVVLLLTASALASEEFRNSLIGEKIEAVDSGIDNSQLLTTDLDNFDMALQIQNVTEDNEKYYIDYSFWTIAIQNNVWQEVLREKRLAVSKKNLADGELTVYVTEELGQVVDNELAYLKEAQMIEKEKGLQKIVASVEYTGLRGLLSDLKEMILPEPTCQPKDEVCDGEDNDCDNLIDEDLGKTTCGIGACQSAIENCLNGALLACVPAAPIDEICDDSIDNNCDGTIDNPEICQPKVAIQEETPIEEPTCQPSTEICDGVDNDCDNLIDEDLIQQCGITDVGACQFGMQTCSNGAWGECIGAVEPMVEICDDGIDNDCDSKIDAEDEDCQDAPPEVLREAACDSEHLDLCETETDCLTAEGYWYNEQCNTEAEAPAEPEEPVCNSEYLDLCTTQELCEGASLYWYNETCNTEPETPTCVPDWSCTEWQPDSSSVACGETVNQTRTCTDLNECDTDEGKPTEEQQAVGTNDEACDITSCDFSLNLAGECQNTCLEGSCQACTPTCTCAEGFFDCDNDLTNGCETEGDCPTTE